MNTISIQIPSIIENIRMIESYIDNAKERFQLDDDLYGNIMISVTEAVNNAIKHGNSGNSTKNVFLSLTLDDNLLKFLIKMELEINFLIILKSYLNKHSIKYHLLQARVRYLLYKLILKSVE